KLAEAEAKQRKAKLKVDVPPELVAANSLAEAKADLALATNEIAYLKDKLRLGRQEGEAGLRALADKRDRAASRVAEAQRAIAQMTVTAPRDGTVIYIATRQSEKKKVGDSSWRGEKLIEIPDLRKMSAEGEIDEADAGRVAVGQRVTLRLDAHPDVTFSGRVELIRAAVQSRSQNNPQKVVRLRVVLDRTDPQRMRPGMRFLGTIEIARIAQALVAPAEAVFNRADGAVVYRQTRFGVEAVKPELGRRNSRWVEIVRGLAAGDRVSRRIPEGMESDAAGRGGR
ncbi:MAG TPA: efflux RND transporter periplasmic adaptor subunit, partial [Thermoanaerobaculia bacterium]